LSQADDGIRGRNVTGVQTCALPILKLREQQMRNAFFLLLMAQGTPCILAGDEFANSQNGNNNVYCQDNDIAWVNWKKAEKEQWRAEKRRVGEEQGSKR